eukprot:TRINITY_DN15059_c0_g1_i1.p1 TRINITY_DN15059_c0_g1~~TRINITY_DN15059_c0_g1_i1.p1  ORF type:complete len:533 (-),score=90.90 TRINITY_DN15059_c0_g1_i1:113-1654(-)
MATISDEGELTSEMRGEELLPLVSTPPGRPYRFKIAGSAIGAFLMLVGGIALCSSQTTPSVLAMPGLVGLAGKKNAKGEDKEFDAMGAGTCCHLEKTDHTVHGHHTSDVKHMEKDACRDECANSKTCSAFEYCETCHTRCELHHKAIHSLKCVSNVNPANFECFVKKGGGSGAFCGQDQHVVSNECQPCPAGTSNPPGDDATGHATTCAAIKCEENQHVVSNACKPCEPGTRRAAGDDASGDDTTCDVIKCEDNQHVVSHACQSCEAGTTKSAGDDASGDDTVCDALKCEENQHVTSHACQSCEKGTTKAAGDDASGDDTTCDAIKCEENQHVATHACQSCEEGTTNAAGDDASGGDTTCDAITCKENEHVVSHACQPCESGKTNAAGDDASGADTNCQAPVRGNCYQCGDADTGTPCSVRELLLGKPLPCPDSKPLCMNDVRQDGTSRYTIKRCVSLEVCRTDWFAESSDLSRCATFDPDKGAEVTLDCHFCCRGAECNKGYRPPRDTWWKP